MRMGTRLAALAMVGTMLGWTALAEAPAVQAEREIFAAINEARREQRLAPLHWDESLAAAARRHAAAMAAHGSAQHGFEGEAPLSARARQAGARFHWLSENVAQGPTPAFIHTQFMHSPAHRANILDRDMDSVGVGVVEEQGQFFAVEDFSQAQ